MDGQNQNTSVITQARSICWEAYGVHTEEWNDSQCLIRAAALEENKGPYLDLAEEIAGSD